MPFIKNDKNILNWKGRKRGPMSEEQKKKVSLAKMGQPSWNKGLTGLPPRHTIPHTEETKRKIGLKSIGRRPPNFIASIRWKKKQALIKDDYTCRHCGLRDPEIMEVDHIIPKGIRPDLFNSQDNLQTLCPNCHRRKTNIDKKMIVQKRSGL